jgi:hypothetical protein
MDNIFGERIVLSRTPGWHKLGTVFTDPTTPSEGLKMANMDYQIFKAQMAGQIETPFGTQLVPVEGKSILFREPTADDPLHRFLGTCGEDYEIVQNSDVASALDRLADTWPLETMGALDRGKTMFATLDAGLTTVAGEEVHQYFLATNTSDGGTSMKIAFTPVRVVCQNTLVTGLKSATVSAALSHSRGILASLDARVDVIKKMQKASFTTLQAFEAMAKAAVDEAGTRAVLEAVYPLPVKPAKLAAVEGIDSEQDIALLGQLWAEADSASQTWEYYCQRQMGFRSLAERLFARVNDEHPAIAGTGWALYNAVVESADYRKGADSVAQSSIWGTRANEKKAAFSAVMAQVR